MTKDREIVYDLFSLSYPVRMKIYRDLNLLSDKHTSLDDAKLVREVLRLAKEAGVIDKLKLAIDAAK